MFFQGIPYIYHDENLVLKLLTRAKKSFILYTRQIFREKEKGRGWHNLRYKSFNIRY